MHLPRAGPALGGHVFEGPVSEIAIDQPWAATRVFFEDFFYLRVDVAGDRKDVRPPVIVQIDQPRSPLNVSGMIEARRPRSVFKEAATHVLVKRRKVVGKMSLKYVREPVAVVIGNGDAHSRLR